MKYSSICHECRFKSGRDEAVCPECGAEKHEKFIQTNFYSILIHSLAKKLPVSDNADMMAALIINAVLMLLGVLILNPLLETSELLWIFFLLYVIQGIMKQISARFPEFRNLNVITRGIIFAYLGAGVGNFISYAGKSHHYYFAKFFYPDMLIREIGNGNTLIISGAILGVLSVVVSKYIVSVFK